MDMVTVAKGIGERVRKHREGAGLTQEKLAYATDLSFTTISSIERGTRPPDLETLYRLAGALGIEVCRFLKDDNKKEVSRPTVADVRNRKELAAASALSEAV